MSKHISGAGGFGLGSGGGIANAHFIDEFYPHGIRLNALYKKGFAYKTIGYRLPVTLTKIIDQLSRDKNEIGDQLGLEARDEIKNIVGSLAQLKNELQTNKCIRLLPISPSPNTTMNPDDEKIYNIWNEYYNLIAATECSAGGPDDGVRWYNAPWLYIECYLYRRIYEAFKSTSYLSSFDYFTKQKQAGYYESIKDVITLAEFMTSTDPTLASNQQILLELSLWGNRCDLSLNCGESASEHSLDLLEQLQDLQDQCLCNDSKYLWKKLKELKESAADNSESEESSIGYVVDNAGFELFTDLCLADSMLMNNYVQRIDFYVKTIPWFISDTMTADVEWLINVMESDVENPAVQELGRKWKNYFTSKRWRIIAEEFWTFPHSYTEMKEYDYALYEKLKAHSLLIFKGDLNYRKLVGDRNWKKSTSFEEALESFRPAPCFALRTIKADTVVGVDEVLAEELDKNNPDWMITGVYGLLQYAGFN